MSVKVFPFTANLHDQRVLGAIVELMLVSPTPFDRSELDNLLPAIWLNQIDLFYNKNHAICAFCAWASVSDEVSEKLKEGDNVLHESEWNEGNNVWLVKAAIAPFYGFESLKAIRSSMLRRSELFRYVRKTKVGRRIVSVGTAAGRKNDANIT